MILSDAAADGSGGPPQLAVTTHDCSSPHAVDADSTCALADGITKLPAAAVVCNGAHTNGIPLAANGHAHEPLAGATGFDKTVCKELHLNGTAADGGLGEGMKSDSLGIPETPSLGSELRGGFMLPPRHGSMQAQARAADMHPVCCHPVAPTLELQALGALSYMILRFPLSFAKSYVYLQ